MPFLLKPDLFVAMTSNTDVEKLMKEDIKNYADKLVDYVAAKAVPVGSRKIDMFVVTDDVKGWQDAFKTKKAAKVATGECKIFKGNPLTVAVKTATGDTRPNVVSLADGALKEFKAIDFAVHLAQQSHDAAPGASGRPPVKIDDQVVSVMLRASAELTEYKKFAASFEQLAKRYNMTDYKKVPVDIWHSMLIAMKNSKYLEANLPKSPDGKSLILAYQGDEGKVVREAMLAETMKGMTKFAQHAGTYLDKVVAELRKAGGTPTWSFWSGDGAKDAARAQNTGGVVLEGTVGSWFDDVWDFQPFTGGVSNMALWTSLSELYAQKAAEYYDKFNFVGYVGRGATREQSVFNKIEQPTFIEVLTVKQKVAAPSIAWFVVPSQGEPGGRWQWTGAAPSRASSRDEALAAIKRAYGG